MPKKSNNISETSTTILSNKSEKVKWGKGVGFAVDGDSEYQPRTDDKTTPITVQLVDIESNILKSFLHPRADKRVLEQASRPTFKSGFALLDSSGLECKRDETKVSGEKSYTIVYEFFHAIKDVEFLFADESDYRKYVLPYLNHKRRWTFRDKSDKETMKSVPLPWKVKVKDPDDFMRWKRVRLAINDVSAIQGGGTLKTNCKNVGIILDNTKDTYTQEQKGNMTEEILKDSARFYVYAEGDVLYRGESLLELMVRLTNEQYNWIASDILGLKKRESWGMSTGQITAAMFTEWLAKRILVKTCDYYQMLINELESKDSLPKKDEKNLVEYQKFLGDETLMSLPKEDLHRINHLAGSEGCTNLSRVLKDENLVWLGMVCGGRAIKERTIAKLALYQAIDKSTESDRKKRKKALINEVMELSRECTYKDLDKKRQWRNLGRICGLLIDIDISGAYGNGLKVQLYCVGNPIIENKPMSVGEFIAMYDDELVPGAWVARIKWKNAPFKQDLLISKVERKFTNWEMGIAGFDAQSFSFEDDTLVFDASMILTTKEVKNAALTHDLWQCIKKTASKEELEWILDNAIVTASAVYRKSDRVDVVTPEMLRGSKILKSGNTDICHQWVGIPMKDFVEPLLKERDAAEKKYGRKSPQRTFLKLIINCIYGTIASAYFSNSSAAVSNFVVGSNITARCRALAWLMAKGFHSHISVTDGGVFELNSVLKYNNLSLDNLARVKYDNLRDKNNHKFAKQVPLMPQGRINKTELKELFPDEDKGFEIDKRAWQHLKEQFGGGIDILDEDQFKFSSKAWYEGLTVRNKTDYRLTGKFGTEKNTIALRGFSKIVDEKGDRVVDPQANQLFNAIEMNLPMVMEVRDTQRLSLADWEVHERKDYLLPGDDVTVEKRYYSITPLGDEFETMDEYKRLVVREYSKAKDESAIAVAEVSKTYNQTIVSKTSKTTSKKKRKSKR